MDLEAYKKSLIEILPRLSLLDGTGVWDLLMIAVWYPLVEAQGLPFAVTHTTLYGQMDRVELLKFLSDLPTHCILEKQSEKEVRQVHLTEDNSMGVDICVDYHRQYIEGISLTFYGTNEPIKAIMDPFMKKGFNTTRQQENTVGVYFGYMAGMKGTQTKQRDFPPLILDSISQNYVPQVVEATKELIEILKTDTQGLVIIRGPVGSGKTFLIRAILSEIERYRTGLVCVPPMDFLNSPMELYNCLARVGKPLVIFEDLGELVRKESKISYASQFANLANLTDGLLSLLHTAIYLITFNYDLKDIDEALLRDGRCLMDIEVPRLPIKQARTLLPDDVNLGNKTTLSLAEVYALKLKGKARIVEAPTLGFKTRDDYYDY